MPLSERTKKKLQEVFARMEVKGFERANRLHRYSINTCLLFIAYQGYAFLRDYNDFFLHARQINNLSEDISGPINSQTGSE